MFAKVRPRELSIESSMLSVFRPGAFDNIGKRLKKLNLRNNIIKTIDPFIFKEITAVEEVDMSKNKINSITVETFAPLKELKSLLLEGNQISNIEDSSFANSPGLTVLNLANNKIRQIKKLVIILYGKTFNINIFVIQRYIQKFGKFRGAELSGKSNNNSRLVGIYTYEKIKNTKFW